MEKTVDIHKGGRPPVPRPASFYQNLLSEYNELTTRQMAAAHGVCRGTIQRWLKIAREQAAKLEQEES